MPGARTAAMTTLALIPLALVIGATIPIQVALNSQLTGVTGSPLTSSLIAFVIGSVVIAVVWVAIRPAVPSPGAFASAPKTVWFGGVMAAIYLVSVVSVAPRLGVGLTTCLILVGQLVTALAIDHFGAFGSPHQAMNLWRLGGLALMVGGVVIVKTH